MTALERASTTRARRARALETMASNAERKRAETKLPGHFPGVAGAFVRVTMHNFMCHANAKVDLGPRINYITGENGSGKSAILTALAVALGAKMKSIGRSSTKSAKGMIKTGSSYARVVVVISNDGEDAFKTGGVRTIDHG